MWSQDDVDALAAALRTGQRRVRFKDREVEYQDLTEMRKLLSEMRAEVASAAGAASVTYVQTSKGL